MPSADQHRCLHLTIALRHITLIMGRVFDLRLLRGTSQLKSWNHLVRINEMLT
jgi:hypothetical protein